MSNENKNSSDSTVLHLNKFAPGAAPKDPGSDTGVTVMIKRAAAETVEQGAAPVVPKESGALPAEQMLGAVSYCYAKGVYESEEIERKMMRDRTLREAVHGEVPDAHAIRKFRRLNRGAIQKTLGERKKKSQRPFHHCPDSPHRPRRKAPPVTVPLPLSVARRRIGSSRRHSLTTCRRSRARHDGHQSVAADCDRTSCEVLPLRSKCVPVLWSEAGSGRSPPPVAAFFVSISPAVRKFTALF